MFQFRYFLSTYASTSTTIYAHSFGASSVAQKLWRTCPPESIRRGADVIIIPLIFCHASGRCSITTFDAFDLFETFRHPASLGAMQGRPRFTNSYAGQASGRNLGFPHARALAGASARQGVGETTPPWSRLSFVEGGMPVKTPEGI